MNLKNYNDSECALSFGYGKWKSWIWELDPPILDLDFDFSTLYFAMNYFVYYFNYRAQWVLYQICIVILILDFIY